MISTPSAAWYGAGLNWSARHIAGFGLLSIWQPDPDDPFHRALGIALDGGAERLGEILSTVAGVIAGEILREGSLAGKLKTEAEGYEAATILDLTTGENRIPVGVAERKVKTNPTYQKMMRERRVAEARVVGLRHYAQTIERAHAMHRTDRADARAYDTREGAQ